MEGVALAIIFASMVLDRLPAAVYLDTPRLATTALVRTSHGCVCIVPSLNRCVCKLMCICSRLLVLHEYSPPFLMLRK